MWSILVFWLLCFLIVKSDCVSLHCTWWIYLSGRTSRKSFQRSLMLIFIGKCEMFTPNMFAHSQPPTRKLFFTFQNCCSKLVLYYNEYYECVFVCVHICVCMHVGMCVLYLWENIIFVWPWPLPTDAFACWENGCMFGKEGCNCGNYKHAVRLGSSFFSVSVYLHCWLATACVHLFLSPQMKNVWISSLPAMQIKTHIS